MLMLAVSKQFGCADGGHGITKVGKEVLRRCLSMQKLLYAFFCSHDDALIPVWTS
jgi:hypothetical protein